MKTKAVNLVLLLTATFLMGLNLESDAQSRGRDRGREQYQSGQQHNGNHDNDRHHDGHDNGRHASYYDHRGSAYPAYQPGYRRLPPQRVVVYRQQAPRYVYYRDYNVYYDYTRNAYISFSGRNWVVTTTVPVGMRYVNRAGMSCSNVDYYNDDFPQYLDRGWSY